MAKKKEIKNEVDDEMDFGDIEDLGGDDLDLGDMGDIDASSRTPTMAGVSKELAKEGGKGFLEGLIKHSAKNSLPNSYSENYSEIADYADFAKETFDVNKSKISKSVYKLGKEVKKILPFQFKTLDNYLQNYEDENSQYQQESEEAQREGSIQSSVASIFDKQIEMQKAMEARHSAEDQVLIGA